MSKMKRLLGLFEDIHRTKKVSKEALDKFIHLGDVSKDNNPYWWQYKELHALYVGKIQAVRILGFEAEYHKWLEETYGIILNEKKIVDDDVEGLPF